MDDGYLLFEYPIDGVPQAEIEKVEEEIPFAQRDPAMECSFSTFLERATASDSGGARLRVQITGGDYKTVGLGIKPTDNVVDFLLLWYVL